MATRLYIPNAPGPFTPATNGTWGYVSEAAQRRLTTQKTNVAMVQGVTIGPFTATVGFTGLEGWYTSPPMPAGQSISGTVKAYLQALEVNAADNVTSQMELYVVSRDGATVRATLLAIGNYGSANELNTALRNKAFADGDTISSYTTVEGDRLVWCIGGVTQASAATPEFAFRLGDLSADCAENETNTGSASGWIELSATLTFRTVTAVVQRNDYSSSVASSYQTAADYTPIVGDVLEIQVTSANAAATPNQPTLSGWSLSYQLIDTQVFGPGSGDMRVTGFYAIVNGSPSAGRLTADFAGQTQGSGCAIMIASHAGVDLNSPVRQSVKKTGPTYGGALPTLTFASTPLVDNSLSCMCGTYNDTTITPLSGHGLMAGSPSGISSLGDVAYMFRQGGKDTAVGWTHSGGNGDYYGGIGIEWNIAAIVGTLNKTLADVTVVAAATVAVAATLAKTLDDLTLSATGTIGGTVGINADLNVTLDALVSTATAAIKVQGSTAATLADVVSTSTATIQVAATLNITLDALTCVAILERPPIQADVTQTLSSLIATATATVAITAQALITLDQLNLSAAAAVLIEANLSATLDDVTLAATIGSSTVAILDVTLEDASLAASAVVDIAAQVSATLANVTSLATATVLIVGQLATTLDDLTTVATLAIQIGASADNTLDDATLDADARVIVAAMLNQTLQDVTGSAQATVTTHADVHATLDDVTLSAAITLTGLGFRLAELAATLDALTSIGTATVLIRAQVDVVLQNLIGFATPADGIYTTFTVEGTFASLYDTESAILSMADIEPSTAIYPAAIEAATFASFDVEPTTYSAAEMDAMRIARGTARDLKIPITSVVDGSPFNLTGKAIRVVIKKHTEDTAAILTKQNTDAGGNDAQLTLEGTNTIVAHFLGVDTLTLDLGMYSYDASFKADNDEWYPLTDPRQFYVYQINSAPPA